MKPAYFDCHCDTLSVVASTGDTLRQGKRHVTLDAMKDYAHYVQFFAIFTNMGAGLSFPTEQDFMKAVRAGNIHPSPALYAHYELLVREFDRQMDILSDIVTPCRSVADIAAARKAGKIAAVLTLEGAEQLGKTSVEDAYARGVRACTLTWNYANLIGGSNISGGGLTDYGRDFLTHCENVGMLVDVSHSSEALFYDVAKYSRVPFIASHSNARAVGHHRRNLTDEQFLALARAGGVAGFNLYGAFIRDGGACTIDDCADHIEHFLALGGAKHIAMGGDLDGCEQLPEGIEGSGDVYKIADALAARNIPVSIIEDIFYNNILRVCNEVWK
ncbi:MAG: membrane dipeptidase [Clostridiaceae bacterium]|nr:membrane dipeptidase [Clostridiaceae bacterium]